jgi:hypothetical protein
MDQFFQARGVDGLSGLQLHVTHVLARALQKAHRIFKGRPSALAFNRN